MPVTRTRRRSTAHLGWFDAMSFTLECQDVIGRRLLRIAGGGPAAAREARRMVAEKVAVAAKAQLAAILAMPFGMEAAGAHAAAEYRRAVRANLRRLSR